jgi:hypothetical protein
VNYLRFISGAVALGVCLSAARPARAQYMTHEWVLSAGGGLSDPTGVFEEQMQMGTHAVLSLGHHFNPSWFLGLRGGYFPFDAEVDWSAATGQTSVRFWGLDLETRLMLYPESRFTPYLVLGAGASLETQWYGDTTTVPDVQMVRPGVTGGVGLSLHRERRRLSLYTELIYHHFPAEDGSRQYLRWTTGLRFSLGGRPF